MFEKAVIVTRKTRLEELIARFNTKSQAKFYIEHSGGDFEDYQTEHDNYMRSLEVVRSQLNHGLKTLLLDRSFLPSVMITKEDVVITVGQDGLVANTAKYIGRQPLIAVNPDPQRFDGILLPFKPEDLSRAVGAVLENSFSAKYVTMAEAVTNDKQRLLAFNDFFIGPSWHTSARYLIRHAGRQEPQSSSGIIVSTGAGSTGWLSSVFNMAAGITAETGGAPGERFRMDWDDSRLFFAVREPFISKHSTAAISSGWIEQDQPLELESTMAKDGILFSDGVQQDFINFNAGTSLSIRAAESRACLVTN